MYDLASSSELSKGVMVSKGLRVNLFDKVGNHTGLW